MIKLNLGCGINAPDGWVNIDISIHAILSKVKPLYRLLCRVFSQKEIDYPANIVIRDIRRGLPYQDNAVTAIFSSHLLEHMSLGEAQRLFRESYRCLCPGGILRVITPDLYQEAKRYIGLVDSSPQADNSRQFLKAIGIEDASPKGINRLLSNFFSHQRHLYLYDELSLRELFEEAGFKDIRRMGYGESRIPAIIQVEREDRHYMAICLEAVK